MVTTATQHIYKWVLNTLEKELPQVKIVHFWVETLHSGDKRPAAINQQRTRGVYAMAEAWIPESILKSVLKVNIRLSLQPFPFHFISLSLIFIGLPVYMYGRVINIPLSVVFYKNSTAQKV